jgi:hypothetical protein
MEDMAGILRNGVLSEWLVHSRPLLIGSLIGAMLGLGLGWFGILFGSAIGGLIGELAYRILGIHTIKELLSGNRILTPKQAIWAVGATSVLIGCSRNHGVITHKQLDLFLAYLTQLDPSLPQSKANQLQQSLADYKTKKITSSSLVDIPSDRELIGYLELAKQLESTDTLLVWMYHLGSATEEGSNQQWVEWLRGFEPNTDFLTHARLTWYPNHQALALLNLSVPCDFNQVKTAYRKTLLQVHPDHSTEEGSESPSTTEGFLALQEAYKLLEWQHTLPEPS